jgi:hypothetical protein
MRRFVTLAVLLLFTVPFGVSLSGCSKAAVATFCNGQNSGVVVGQTTTLDLEPRLTGISLNQGQIGSVSGPSAKDCKGTSTSVTSVAYGSTDITLVDVVPQTGRVCAGTWNRQTGGGIPDYTVCTPTTRSGTAFITASSQGVTSNPLPVYVHPIVTNILLGPPSTNCSTDPASNCYDTAQVNGACLPNPIAVKAYDGNSCLSQGSSAQLVARAFKGTDVSAAGNNISCLVGPLTFSALNASVVTIDTNGLATASQPGSSVINAASSQASSSAGFFSTCPPQSIVLTPAGSTTPPTAPISVNQNTAQTLVATVKDTKGAPITNVQLEYVSTTPTTIPTSGSVITPTFPGSAAITAICQPPSCNSSPFNLIGLFGNGTPVTSNPVQINAKGTSNSTVLYIGSTNSQYLQPVDFTVATQSASVRLPYVPNSMVISEDLSTIYMGSSTEIMVFSTPSNAVSRQDTQVVGTVLAVSPDNSTVVITDPSRNLVYLYASSGTVTTEFGGVATRAQFSPDSQTVYITTTDGRLLVHSTFTGWTSVPLANVASDVAVTVPNAGVYLGGAPVTARTNCPATSVTGSGLTSQTTNVFYPQVDVTSANASRVAATNDGVHILGASTTAFTDITTNTKSGGCPVAFTSSTGAPKPLGVAATAITNVLPTSDSAFALVTYQGSGGVVPQYAPASGTLSSIALQQTASGVPIAPVAGIVSSDNQTVFIGTSGDNLVHRLTRGANGFSDTLAPIIPALPGFTGGTATPDLLVQKPRKSTS